MSVDRNGGDQNVTENAGPCQYVVYFHKVLIIADLTSTFSAHHPSHCLHQRIFCSGIQFCVLLYATL